MPKKRSTVRSRSRRIKLTTDLKILQIIIVIILFAFAFTVLGFLAQILTPDPNKTTLNLPETVLTQANLLINTSRWKTYNSQGIKFKYPDSWILEEKATNFGTKLGTYTFFGPKKDSHVGLALITTPQILPGEWINKVYAPGFLRQAESISLIKVDNQTTTKVVNLPQAWENEMLFINKNSTTYIFYVRGNDEEIKFFETLIKTIKLS